jgi:hypothetical protein
MPTKDGALKAREFLFFTEDLTVAALPPELAAAERKVMWTVLQLSYGNPLVHFELQPQPSRGIVELGLHFEGETDANEAGALLLAGRTHEIRAALGPEWELEEWTASWRRLHRTFPFTRLTAALGREIAEEMAKAITVLAPLVRGMEMPMPAPKSANAPASRRHFGRNKARAAR